MDKQTAEHNLRQAMLWLKEARQFGGELSGFKKSLRKAKREATEAGIDVEAFMSLKRNWKGNAE